MTDMWIAFKATKFSRSCRALWNIKFDLMPKWMVPVFVVCLFIPGPFDETLGILVISIRVALSSRLRHLVADTIRAA